MRRISKRNLMAGRGIVDIWKREVGVLPPRAFAHRVAASKGLVLRLDDKMVKLWNWNTGVVKLSFDSGHKNNVFQARIMPYTDDATIVTCAADGEVRYAQIREGGKVDTTLLAVHEGRAHKLAIEPGSPHIFYSSAEDGLVQHFDLRTKSATQLFSCHSFGIRSSYMPIVNLNAIAIDQRHPNFFVIGGSDEYARLYDIRKCKRDGSANHDLPVDCFCPSPLIGDKYVGITGVSFSDQSELLVSYNNENIYLFPRGPGLGPDPVPPSPKSSNVEAGNSLDTGTSIPAAMDADENPGPQVYVGHRNAETVKGVGFFGPSCEYVVSGSDCGNIFIWEKKGGELLRVMEADKRIVNCIEPHPHTTLLASSGIENDIKIWTPNAREPAPPVNLEELKLKQRRRGRLCRFALSEDMLRQVFVMRRQHGDDSMDAEMTYFLGLADDDSSSDDSDKSDGPDLSDSEETKIVPFFKDRVSLSPLSKDAAMGLVLSAAAGRGWTTGSGMEGPSTPAVGSGGADQQVSTFPWSLFTKSPRRRMRVAFTCNVCGQRTTRAINPHAYTDGTVFVQCCGCNVFHKLVDNLNLFHDMKCYVDPSFNPEGGFGNFFGDDGEGNGFRLL
ncbi:hypothetical protein QJS10_CPA01g00327 [Acorus calamus]|uniref:DNL-type domain-containing protein n=1 Tax=Acorus calamus TaxID=4465 RepID=A0AAV9FLC2_ACOCL|nr:hypothetical protein QJS10_CPA01g00327 [Acorus calamus]